MEQRIRDNVIRKIRQRSRDRGSNGVLKTTFSLDQTVTWIENFTFFNQLLISLINL